MWQSLKASQRISAKLFTIAHSGASGNAIEKNVT